MKVRVRVKGGCDVWRQERKGEDRRTGESCIYMTNKALDVKKTTLIKRGKRTNPAKKPLFFFRSHFSVGWMKSSLASSDQHWRTVSSLSCSGNAAADRTILKTLICAKGPEALDFNTATSSCNTPNLFLK